MRWWCCFSQMPPKATNGNSEGIEMQSYLQTWMLNRQSFVFCFLPWGWGGQGGPIIHTKITQELPRDEARRAGATVVYNHVHSSNSPKGCFWVFEFHCNFTPFRFGISMTQASIFQLGNSSLRPRPGKLKDDYVTNPTYKSNYMTEMSKIGEMNLQIYSII